MSIEKVVIGNATLYHGDALEVLAGIADPVDAVITDPPYCSGSVSEASRTAAKGQGLRSETLKRFGWFSGDNMGTAGLAFLLRSVACAVPLREDGSLLVFCDWRMVANLAPSIESSGLRFQNLIVWDKGSMGLGLGFRTQHEMVLHFTAGAPKYHDMGTSNVIAAGRIGAGDRVHQTEKPVDLLAQLQRVVAPVGGLVLDPFMGSGSTGVAALQGDRRFVGIERERRYFDIACERISRAQAQGSLLPPEAPQPEQLSIDA